MLPRWQRDIDEEPVARPETPSWFGGPKRRLVPPPAQERGSFEQFAPDSVSAQILASQRKAGLR